MEKKVRPCKSKLGPFQFLEEEDRMIIRPFEIPSRLLFFFCKKSLKALQYTNELISVDPGHPRAHGNKLYYESNLDDDDSSDTDSRKKVRKTLVSRLIKVKSLELRY